MNLQIFGQTNLLTNRLLHNQLKLSRNISTSPVVCWISKLTRLRVVDNSAIGKQAMLEGKPPKVIHTYTKGWKPKKVAKLGDKVMVAIKGEKKRGYIVGAKQLQFPMIPKFDTNNIVLIDEKGNPLGTRVVVPIPNFLRTKGPELHKIIAIASKFV